MPRQGHCRVFKNAIHKDSIHKAWAGTDSTFPFKLTEDLKTIVDKRIKEAKADFTQIPKEEIMHKDLSLPDIEPISFRILNLAQNLFFYLSYKCGLLSDEHYEKCKSGEIDCKRNIECNLTVITQLLEKINIKNVALFLNFVFDKIILENLIGAKRL